MTGQWAGCNRRPRPFLSRPRDSRSFQRRITASASARAARSAFSLGPPALMSPDCYPGHPGGEAKRHHDRGPRGAPHGAGILAHRRRSDGHPHRSPRLLGAFTLFNDAQQPCHFSRVAISASTTGSNIPALMPNVAGDAAGGARFEELIGDAAAFQAIPTCTSSRPDRVAATQ
jgi:hypothetical protein